MLADSRIVYLFVYVSDLERSRAWYTDVLGLRVIEEDADCVKFDGGQVILALNRAADYGIGLPRTSDGCADIVFLVDDLVAMREALERRGVTFNPTSWYEPGGLADFYDPDHHWFTLYQPSDAAMGWPSGDRIRGVMRARREAATVPAPAATPRASGGDLRLDGCDIIYTFFFVLDPSQAQRFYHDELGIQALEGGPCSQLSAGDEDGVVKYDTGGMMLTTHFIEPARTAQEVMVHSCPPRELDPGAMRSVAPAFLVPDLDRVVESLGARKNGGGPSVSRSAIGSVASLTDPSGHLVFLYDPSEAAMGTPSGAKIQSILATPL
jgi:catechol 2,3-dioxygenase-like lactoylglutathione lyase family enzyme